MKSFLALLLLSSSAFAQTVNVSPTTSLPASTTNDSAAAGNLGEYIVATANGEPIAATFTNASPTVVTMTGNTFAARCVIATGSANKCVLPVYFTGLAGTNGVTNNTAYYVDPASISGSTFKIATSVANALAGTDVNTTGTDSGTGIAANYITTSGVGQAMIGLSLTAGDWDCNGNVATIGVASTAPSALAGVIAGGAGTMNFNNESAQLLQLTFSVGALSNVLVYGSTRRSNASQANVFANVQENWTGGATSPTATGNIRCRRVR